MQEIIIHSYFYKNPRFLYVLDQLAKHPLLIGQVNFACHPEKEKGYTSLSLSANSETLISFKNFSHYFDNAEVEDLEYPQGKVSFQNFSLPVFTTQNAQNLAFRKGVNEFDPFESMFFYWSRVEEWSTNIKVDAHDRFPSHEHFLVKNGLENIPVLDLLIFGLFDGLNVKLNEIDPVLHLSHDLDMIKKYGNRWKTFKVLMHSLLIQRNLRIFKRTLNQIFISKKDPYDTFQWLLSKDDGTIKDLFILNGGSLKGMEAFFSINEKEVKEKIKLGIERNYTIAYHPSYFASENEALFQKEKQGLEQTFDVKIEKCRTHFLRWKFPETPIIIEQNQIGEDCSMGFNDRIGYRAGTAFPFQLYHFKEERAYRFHSRPMIMMDIALLRMAGYDQKGNYKDELMGRVGECWNQFQNIQKGLPFKVPLSINFHNSIFDNVYLDAEEFKSFYLSLIGE
ncbi:MAG: hypothetical protein R2879_14720 [Saprospiraceae bacterium]